MNIALVRIALSRPYTLRRARALDVDHRPARGASRTPTDIFPDIRIPVIGVVWHYTGLPPDQMAGRITTQFQRALTTTVNDIEHIEANSYNGFGIVKIFFQPDVDIRTANAQVTADLADAAQADAAGHDAAADPQLQRLDGADHPARAVGRGPVRAEPRRPRHQPVCARRWSPCPAPRFRIRSAASSARCRSTSIRRRCRRAACPARTSPTRSPRRT